jgi:predicted phosphodiesterase
MTHTPGKHANDLPDDPDPAELAQNGAVHIVLHGHTHIPRIEKDRGVWFVNPGHLRSSDKKGYPPSFAVIGLQEMAADVRIIDILTGREILGESFRL